MEEGQSGWTKKSEREMGACLVTDPVGCWMEVSWRDRRVLERNRRIPPLIFWLLAKEKQAIRRRQARWGQAGI